MSDCRYIVGIDLGTTNCAVSYVDTAAPVEAGAEPEIFLFDIPQVVEPGRVEALPILPSFAYLPAASEFPRGSLALPWSPAGEEPAQVVGSFALKRGSEVPVRLVSSAKSWLCHPQLDRNAPILPWSGPEELAKLSPVDASALYLNHIRAAWNHALAADDAALALEEQEIFLTVPASFDAVARELTVQAARKAGLSRVTLLEEPQAAFYAWICSRKDEWRKAVTVGDVVLVCDIGGGTTDLSLIRVSEEEGTLALERIAVGDHILLGGDNMDLMLAYAVRKHFSERKIALDSRQMLGLVYNCRVAKEKVLNDRTLASHPVVILGRGRGVVGGTLQTEIERRQIEQTVLEGFFSVCGIEESPARRGTVGFRELGLHYEADTCITKHIARFLRRHADRQPDRVFLHPQRLLFNGGVTKSPVIRSRVKEVLDLWLHAEEDDPVRMLKGDNPDFAVALGAAYYGLAKLGHGVRIRGGTARSYYVGIETAMPAVPGMPPPLKAVCVVPFGMEEGTDAEIPGQELGVMIGEQAVFRFLCSSVRTTDRPGLALEDWEEGELEELAPLEATLTAGDIPAGSVIPVRLHSFVTEVGTLELWCEARDRAHRWKLEFNVRES